MTDEHEPRPKLGNTEILLGDSAKSIGPETDEDRLKDDHDYQGSLAETAQKPEKRGWSLKTKIGAGAAAAAILLGVGGLAERQITKKSNSVATGPVPTNPSPTQSATPITETLAPSPETSQSSTKMTAEKLEQETSVEAMEAMSIEEFAQLPYADRVAFAQSKCENQNFFASPDEAFDPTMIPGFYWDQLMLEANLDADPTEGAKMVSAMDYYVANEDGVLNEGYQKIVDSLIEVGGSASVSTTIVYKGHGIKQDGVDRDGNPIMYTDITYQFVGKETAEPIGSIYTAQVLEVETKLNDGRTILTYPRMFGIPGKKSPIEGQPY